MHHKYVVTMLLLNTSLCASSLTNFLCEKLNLMTLGTFMKDRN
jgi:hypothetical protein